jgi:hypothetical protein
MQNKKLNYEFKKKKKLSQPLVLLCMVFDKATSMFDKATSKDHVLWFPFVFFFSTLKFPSFFQ